MAVPKKRTSKSKTKSRKAVWKRQAFLLCQKVLSFAKSTNSNDSKQKKQEKTK